MARTTVRDMVLEGIKVLRVAVGLESLERREVEEVIQHNSTRRKIMRAWRAVEWEGGPWRVAAMRQIHLLRRLSGEVYAARYSERG